MVTDRNVFTRKYITYILLFIETVVIHNYTLCGTILCFIEAVIESSWVFFYSNTPWIFSFLDKNLSNVFSTLTSNNGSFVFYTRYQKNYRCPANRREYQPCGTSLCQLRRELVFSTLPSHITFPWSTPVNQKLIIYHYSVFLSFIQSIVNVNNESSYYMSYLHCRIVTVNIMAWNKSRQ